MAKIQILLNNTEILGSVTFNEGVQSLAGARTASGFRLNVPAAITFLPPSGSTSLMLLENLRTTYSVGDVEIGTAHYASVLRTGAHDQPITFTWDWQLPTLQVYERLRNGRGAYFNVRVHGDLRFVLEGKPGQEPCSIASKFGEFGEVRYSRELWTNTLRQLDLRDAVLVEIPFAADPPNGWEAVWEALRDARDSFDRGGSTGWKNCVASVRNALSEWQQIPSEKEDQGPGWQRPASVDLQARTKEQRTDNIRWHLLQLAHYAAHTKADDWTRDDALLALSTLCNLLAVRRP